jgi:hypothetical protein
LAGRRCALPGIACGGGTLGRGDHGEAFIRRDRDRIRRAENGMRQGRLAQHARRAAVQVDDGDGVRGCMRHNAVHAVFEPPRVVIAGDRDLRGGRQGQGACKRKRAAARAALTSL